MVNEGEIHSGDVPRVLVLGRPLDPRRWIPSISGLYE